jgi:TRAP-type mannitol/chloroaromatic compound transport system permease small subunit
MREVAAMVASERRAITDAIDGTRAALMTETRGVIDHIVWRVIQVGFVILLIAGAFTLFVLRRMRKIRAGGMKKRRPA